MSTEDSGTGKATETNAGAMAAASYADEVKTIIEQLHAILARTPNLTYPTERNSTQKLTTAASVPRPAIAKVVALIQTYPLLTGSEIGPDEIRELVSIASAYGVLPDELEALAGALRHTVTMLMNKVGSVVLAVYENAKRQSKQPESAELRPHVADLRRLLSVRFGRKKNRQQSAQELALDSSDQALTQSASQPVSESANHDSVAATTETKSQSK